MWVLNFVNLSTGGTMFLYNGSPFYPVPDILLRLTEELKSVWSLVGRETLLTYVEQGDHFRYLTKISL
jgi:acyl-coenzyme A synthetase/AMP-(fatty) acid ligase